MVFFFFLGSKLLRSLTSFNFFFFLKSLFIIFFGCWCLIRDLLVGPWEKKKAEIFEVCYAEAMGCMNRVLCVVVSIGLVLISLPHFVLDSLIQPMVKSKITFSFMLVNCVLSVFGSQECEKENDWKLLLWLTFPFICLIPP